MSDPLLSLRGIEKKFRMNGESLTVLQEINLDIFPGTFTAILGPSGAGKSTLLYLMGLLEKPSAGEIYIQGQSCAKISDSESARLRAQTIGFVFQNYHLLREFTVLENIMLPSCLLDMPPKKRYHRARELLEKVNLHERENHRPSELSGGEQQRVSLCRALMNSPSLILADEPTGNLDSQNAALVETLLKSLTQDQKTTLVLVTHNEVLAAHANHRVEMSNGRLVKK
jgi:lipoprotein-releasing system ATP-binding protein